MHFNYCKRKEKSFLKYFCFKWNKVTLGESLFSRWMLLFGIMLERKGVSYLLRIKITLYGSSWHDILITMRSCNSEIVYFSHYSRKVFHLHIFRAPCSYMQIHMFSEFYYNLLCLLLLWEIWEKIILIQFCILFSYVPC